MAERDIGLWYRRMTNSDGEKGAMLETFKGYDGQVEGGDEWAGWTRTDVWNYRLGEGHRSSGLNEG